MKKILLVLGMITCILSLTACGSEKEALWITEEEAIQIADNCIVNISNFAMLQGNDDLVDEVEIAAVDSWIAAQEDIGSYQNIIGHEVEIKDDSAIVTVEISATLRNAEVEISLERAHYGRQEYPALQSGTVNPDHSFGELMSQAFLNTIIGMGTVFCVLILISIIISAFVFIPKIQASLSGKKKKEVQTEVAEKKTVETSAALTVTEEDVSDDLELVAVIAAAIAASEGAASTDGFVVRSIRRVNKNKWQRA